MKKKKNSKKKEKKAKSKKEKKAEAKDIEISDIEEKIKQIIKSEDEDNDFFEEPVRQIPLSAERAPVLERMIQREGPSSFIETPQERTEKREERRVDYSPNANQPNYGFQRNTDEENEKKYESTFVPPILSRREFSPREIRQDFMNSQTENRIHDSNEPLSHDIEFIEEERKLPFEEQQKKYKRFKLR